MVSMNKIDEKALYEPISEWFERYLCSKYGKSKVYVWDSHNVYLSKLLQQHNLHRYFQQFDTFEIKVDISAVILQNDNAQLGFVEVKSSLIRLAHIGQLLGYCRVANPIEAFLISPFEISNPLHSLLIKYGKLGTLDYGKNKIKIAKWKPDANDIEYNSLIPRGK